MDTPTQTAPGARGSGSIAGASPCPHLGSTEGREIPFDHPSRRNVCCAQTRVEWKGLRRKAAPGARIHRADQAAYCLGAFTQCAHFQRAALRAEAGRKSPAAEPSRKASPRRSPRKKRASRETPSRLGRLRSRLYSGRMKTVVQFGTLGLVTVAFALGLTAFFAAEPAKWVDFVYFYIAKEKIRTFAGQGGLGLPQEASTRGVGALKGKSMKDLKNISGAKKKQLMKKFKGMSAAQKAQLRKKFGR